jgi:hypothetical protein
MFEVTKKFTILSVIMLNVVAPWEPTIGEEPYWSTTEDEFYNELKTQSWVC